MALPVPDPKAMLANRRYDSDSFRLSPDIEVVIAVVMVPTFAIEQFRNISDVQ